MLKKESKKWYFGIVNVLAGGLYVKSIFTTGGMLEVLKEFYSAYNRIIFLDLDLWNGMLMSSNLKTLHTPCHRTQQALGVGQ